jgi:Icc-related predicted phosphoesterase
VSLADVPLLYVPGNHDPNLAPRDSTWAPLRHEDSQPGPQGCDNVDGRVVLVRGIRVAGLGGSLRYKPGPNQYSQAQMRWRALRLDLRARLTGPRRGRRVDVLVAHAPPFGVSNAGDAAHAGFAAFRRLIATMGPALFLHGHVHPYGRMQPERLVGSTRVVNAIPSRLVEV